MSPAAAALKRFRFLKTPFRLDEVEGDLPEERPARQAPPETAARVPSEAGSGSGPAGFGLSQSEAEQIVDDGVRRWLNDRRERIEPFVDSCYSFDESLRIHSEALGWDVVRSPINLALAVPQVGVMAAAAGMKQVGRYKPDLLDRANRLSRVNLMLTTDVGRELTFRLYRDFLELPISDGQDRISEKDALSEAVFSDPRVTEMMDEVSKVVSSRQGDGEFRDRLVNALSVYVGNRAAANDIATSVCCVGVGNLVAGRFTPGALSLSTALAGEIAKSSAVSSFPMGAKLGSIFYASKGVEVPLSLILSSGAAVLSVAAIIGAFSGIATDPLQRRMGLHQRRLNR
ncbi:MAG: DUF6635 family protein, partial [Rhodospirillaceae bacterium]